MIKQDTLREVQFPSFHATLFPFSTFLFLFDYPAIVFFFFNYMQISKPPPSLTEGSNIYKFEPCLFSLTVH